MAIDLDLSLLPTQRLQLLAPSFFCSGPLADEAFCGAGQALKLDPRCLGLFLGQGPGRLCEHFAWALCEEGLLGGPNVICLRRASPYLVAHLELVGSFLLAEFWV